MDLDALMADLCSIEQELSTVNAKPNSSGSMARLGITDTKVRTIVPLVAGCTFTDCASYANAFFFLVSSGSPEAPSWAQQQAAASRGQQQRCRQWQ